MLHHVVCYSDQYAYELIKFKRILMMKRIKLFDPSIDKDEENTIRATLKSKFWASGAGIGQVLKFETEFKKYIRCTECITVNSGTAALHLALSLFDVKGKEIILPAITFVSTAHAVVLNGGKPIFADVEPTTLCLDPSDVDQKITTNTKLILPVHFGGMPCDLSRLHLLCKKNNIKIVEDAAHAAGSTFNKKRIGSHSEVACFSFHPIKNLAMPSGGCITLNGKKSSKFKKLLVNRRWCGITNRVGPVYDVKEIGWNYYMNEFSAAIGLVQLKKLNLLNKRRQNIAKRYSKEINVEHKMPFSKDCSYHLYWIIIKNRKKFMKKMTENGIETGIHYIPVNKMTFYKNTSTLANTKKVSKGLVTIPIHPNLSESEISKIIDTVNILV